MASGVLRGSTGGRTVVQDFENIVVQPAQVGDPDVCDILFLDLGPIYLDVLGLTVDLS